MGQLLTTKWLPYMGALAIQGFAATIPVVTVAPTSVFTVTSTYSDTVTSTITGVLPVTTVETTCTPGSVAPESCTNSIWSAEGSYWQEWCSDSSLEGASFMTIHGATSPYECFVFCGIYSSCQGLNWDDNDECVLLTDITSTVEVTSSHWAAIERFSTNPCVVTVTGASTQLSTEITVMEYTTTYTSTITLSTSAAVASTSATSSVATSAYISSVSTSTASTCTVSALPTTTDCVDGYYVYNEEYYQVLCSDTVQGYSGFLPNSRQADIWGCIEVCSTYSNCIGTFWFLGICYSESGAIDYSYVPHAICINCFTFHSFKRLSVSRDIELSYFIGPFIKDVPGLKLPELSFSRALCNILHCPSIRPSEKFLRTSTCTVVFFSNIPQSIPTSARRTTTIFTTETRTSVTTICPLKATKTASTLQSANVTSPAATRMTTSTVFTTKVYTITACPPYTTEIVPIYTTICPTSSNGGVATEPPQALTISTIFTTKVHTTIGCPQGSPHCAASEKTTYYTTETIAAYTTICPVAAEETGIHASGQSTAIGGGPIGQSSERLSTSTVYTTHVYPITACPSSSATCADTERTTYLTTETAVASVTVITSAAVETPAGNLGAPSGEESSVPTITAVLYTTEVFTITRGTETHLTTAIVPITTTMTPTASEIQQFSPTSKTNSALVGPHSPQQGVTGESTIGPGADADGQIGVSAESQGSTGEGSSSPSSSNDDSTHPGTAGSPGPSLHVPPSTISSVGSVANSSLNVSSWSNGSHSLGVASPSLGLNRPTLGSVAGSHTASAYTSGTSTVVSAQYTGSASRSAVWTWFPFVGMVIGYFL
ncbi:hypothetical protein BO79DRAFT_240700 [Aspergillus costaricaensis CBS 115574]|uniref:Uncharacterized protein n=1 Tax=Aspergillus costaricaensis CBS 115574 TaxID=1448317 RepID=A0ACD1I0V0_9EURO|nr:hypothetical protein BO79DRAFT_240700 [Aspergillus costaricaensis CBS 115574]RAK84154.1 hypothetical protein BO79DRAFT_240700 [Aspergillus costaricaensis CBS 115574]